jgi:ABC-type transport system substrate-binding protein
MSRGYWSELAVRRISRRRGLAALSALGAGSVALIACGGGEEAAKSTFNDPSGLLFQPEDSSKEAVAGGVWENYVPSYPEGFDHYRGDNITFLHTMRAYERLVSYKTGTPVNPADGSVEGAAAQSWELSPDKTQITFKLRQGNKLDSRPPTSGRELTSEDVKYSWSKISSTAVGNGRELVNAINPDAPILSMTFPDKYTAAVKLKEPVSSIFGILGYPWYFMIIPTEAEDKFDVRNDMRGTGPWMLTKYERGVGFEYVKNRTYWKKDRPFMDGIKLPLVSETAQQLAQFKAKRIWGPLVVSNENAVVTKRENAGVAMRMQSPKEGQGGMRFSVPSKLEKPDNPYLDVRVRYALSMLIDRELVIEALGNVPALKREGIPVITAWHEFAPAGWAAYGVWHDPKEDKAFWGDLWKYWQYTPDEAAKLLRAAGKYPLVTEYTRSGTLPFATSAYVREHDVMLEMFQQGGHVKFERVNTPDHFSVFDPKYFFGRGQFEGMASGGYGSWPDYDMGIWAIFMPGGRNDYVYKPVPGAYELAKQHRAEFDREKRNKIAGDWSKAMTKEMPDIIWSTGGWSTFTFHWPWLENVGGVKGPIATSEPADVFQHFWYNKTKDTRSA